MGTACGVRERERERVVRKSEKMGVGERREREIRKRPEMVKREEYEGDSGRAGSD